MYYQRLSVVFMALTGVIASPLSGGFDGRLVKRDNQQMARDNGLIELDHEEVEGGRLTYYGVEEWDEIEEPEPTRTVTLAGRADCVDKPVVSCDPDNHQARSNDCDSLVYSLSSDSQRVIDDETQTVCYSGDVGTCCVAWSQPVKGLKKGWLFDYADTIRNECAENRISGLFRGVRFNDKCVNVCLSNSNKCGD